MCTLKLNKDSNKNDDSKGNSAVLKCDVKSKEVWVQCK